MFLVGKTSVLLLTKYGIKLSIPFFVCIYWLRTSSLFSSVSSSSLYILVLEIVIYKHINPLGAKYKHINSLGTKKQTNKIYVWLGGCFEFNGTMKKYFSLSERGRKKKGMIGKTNKYPNNLHLLQTQLPLSLLLSDLIKCPGIRKMFSPNFIGQTMQI